MRMLVIVLLLCALLVSGIHGLSVSGKNIVDANGQPILLRGMNKCSFEWNPAGEHASLADYTLMAGWGSNVVRIPMSQGFWLSTSKSYNAAYKATIQQQVNWIKSLGMYVILDLHWSDQGDLSVAPTQQCMADANSITFWSEVAAAYKSDPNVLFELYNEPHDVSWSVWLNGGSGCGYTVAGMQQMFDAIRATGSNNIVIVGGVNWAFDLSGVATHPVVGTNVAYATHPYNYPGKDASMWDASFGFLTSNFPVLMTEFGQYCDGTNYVAEVLAYCKTKGIHWTAWAWYVNGCSFPSVISDWNGTPSPIVGVAVKAALGGVTTPLTTLPPSTPASNPATTPASNPATTPASNPTTPASNPATATSSPSNTAPTAKPTSTRRQNSYKQASTYKQGSDKASSTAANSGAAAKNKAPAAGTNSRASSGAAAKNKASPHSTAPKRVASDTSSAESVKFHVNLRSTAWWIGFNSFDGVPDDTIVNVLIKDSAVGALWKNTTRETWGWSLSSSSTTPFVAPVSVMIVTESRTATLPNVMKKFKGGAYSGEARFA